MLPKPNVVYKGPSIKHDAIHLYRHYQLYLIVRVYSRKTQCKSQENGYFKGSVKISAMLLKTISQN